LAVLKNIYIFARILDILDYGYKIERSSLYAHFRAQNRGVWNCHATIGHQTIFHMSTTMFTSIVYG
jgi:hypothetical protein